MDFKNFNIDYINAFNFVKSDGRNVSNISDVSFFIINESDFNFFIDNEKIPQDIIDYAHQYMPTRNMQINVLLSNGNITRITNLKIDNNKSAFIISEYKNDHMPTDKAQSIIRFVLTRLNQKDTIIGSREVISKKKSGRDYPITVMYISKKKYLNDIKKQLGEEVEWKHSWDVLGHWRKCRMIGKDSYGDYNQINRTWVSPCIKGDGPLIKKLRIL